MTDVIADMLTRIRNALLAKHETVEVHAEIRRCRRKGHQRTEESQQTGTQDLRRMR